MSRVCVLSGKKVQYGNNVSHANNKSRRRFLPNLQNASFLSDILKMKIRLRISVNGMKTIEKNGGIDAYLLSTAASKLSPKLYRLKKTLEKRVSVINAANAS